MLFRFEGCEVDTGTQELRRGGELVPIEPQVFAVLVHLLTNRDRVVSHDNLLDTVWQGRIVSDTALSSRLKAARKAIGDDGREQRLIRTLHKRGFRFVGDVEAVADPAPPVALPAIAAAAPVQDHPSILPAERDLVLPPVGQPSLAILPFATIGEPSVMADGLAHDLITRLGRARWLFVTARGSAFRFSGAAERPAEIAAKLGVRYIAQGAVQTTEGRIRVHAALIDATTDSEVWSEQFDRRREDLFAVQTEISDAIAGAVESQIELLERGRSLLKPSENLDAWEAFQRGCWHMYQFRPEHYEQAAAFFSRSIELEPTSPRPHSGLSFVHWQRAFLEIGKDRASEISRARDLAERAITLDPRDPQGYHALGRAHILLGDFTASERELQKAVSLNPSFAIGQYSLAFALHFAGLDEESQEAVGLAQRLSPFDPMRFAMLALSAMNLLSLGSRAEAVELIGQAVEQSNAHYHILALAAHITAAAGQGELSAGYLRRLRAIRPGYDFAAYQRAFPMFRSEDIETARAVFGG